MFGAGEAAEIEMIQLKGGPTIEWHSTPYNIRWHGYFLIYKHLDQRGLLEWYLENINGCVLVSRDSRWISLQNYDFVRRSDVLRFYVKTKEDATAFKLKC